MEYYLTFAAGDGGMQKIIDPSPETIEWAIESLIPVEDYFVILESEEPVDNCMFVQTLVPQYYEIEIDYMIEVRFEYDGYHKQYRIFEDNIDVLKKMFRMYALKILPDVTGWEDITEKVAKASKT